MCENMTGTIQVTNRTPEVTEIDIEGVIGVPEQEQFENERERVATYEKFKAQIGKIGTVVSPRIVVNIRSSGGNVNDALLIHDMLKGSGKQVTTRCYGYVASAATIVAQAASDGLREVSANALYLIHRSVSSAEGNLYGMERTADLLRKTDERIAAVYAERSGRPQSEFDELMGCNGGNGRWLSPRETLEAGLADRILGTEEAVRDEMKVRTIRPEISGSPVENNQNNECMRIKRQWKAILNFLGLDAEQDNLMTEKGLEAIDAELSVRRERAEHAPDNLDSEEQKFPEPGEQEARTEATETRTRPKEDPDPEGDRFSGNARSYEEDARNFR